MDVPLIAEAEIWPLSPRTPLGARATRVETLDVPSVRLFTSRILAEPVVESESVPIKSFAALVAVIAPPPVLTKLTLVPVAVPV